MKKFLIIALALVVSTGGSFVSSAHADAPGTGEGSVCNLYDDGSGGGRIQNGQCVPDNLFISQSIDPKAAKTPTVAPPNFDTSSGLRDVLVWIASLFAWLLYVATTTLDYVVYFTVVKMGAYLSNLSAIGVAWRVMRDVGNILLIFGFLAAGIMTILYNVQWYGFNRKMLPMLLVAAVFLNFSLFFAEAVVDTGNLFATQIYQQINGGPAQPPNFDKVSVQTSGISVKIMNQLGLQDIYNAGRTKPEVFKAQNGSLIAFLSIFLFLIATFVFFSLAFILIARFVYLIYLIITSPIGFAGWVFPPLQHTAQKWWSTLFSTAFTAPILFLLLYVALRVITDGQFLAGFVVGQSKPNWTGFITTDAGSTSLMGFAAIFLSFIVAMGLLLFVVIVSKKLSTFGGERATALAGKLSFGLTAWGMRSTVGAGAAALSRVARRNKFGSTKTGRLFVTGLNKVSSSSMDVRGSKVLGGLAGVGVNAGDAQKGGYDARRKAAIEAHEKYASTLTGKEALSKKDQETLEKAQKEHRDAEINKKFAGEDRANATKTVEDLKAEVAHIREEKEKDYYWETNPKNEERLIAAEKALTEGQEKLVKSEEALTAATNAEAEAKKTKETVSSEMAMRKNKIYTTQQLKENYAKNISQGVRNSLPSWLAFGPGGSEAAQKIKKAKTTENQIVDLLEKLKKEKEAKEAKGEKPAEGAGKPSAEGAKPEPTAGEKH